MIVEAYLVVRTQYALYVGPHGAGHAFGLALTREITSRAASNIIIDLDAYAVLKDT